MSELNSTLVSLLLLSGIVLAGALVYVLLRLVSTLRVLEREVTTLTGTLSPLLEKADRLTERAEETLVMFQEHRDSLAASVENIRRVTANVYRLQNIVQQQVEPSLTSFASMLGSARRGIATFIETWKRGR